MCGEEVRRGAGQPTNDNYCRGVCVCGGIQQTRQERGALHGVWRSKLFPSEQRIFNYSERDGGDWLNPGQKWWTMRGFQGTSVLKRCTVFWLWSGSGMGTTWAGVRGSAGRTSRHEMDYTHSHSKRNKERWAERLVHGWQRESDLRGCLVDRVDSTAGYW